MGIFNNNKSKIKAPPPQIRVQAIPVAAKPKPKSATSTPRPSIVRSASSTANTSRLSSPALNRVKSSSPYPSSTDSQSRKRKSRSPASPAVNDFGSDDSDGSDDGGVFLGQRKRLCPTGVVDTNRRLTHPRIWTGTLTDAERDRQRRGVRPRELRIVHAADLANLKLKCKPVPGLEPEEVALELRYPGARQRERYELVHGKDKINAVEDIKKIVGFVRDIYLSEKDAEPFSHPQTGICRRLDKFSSSNAPNGQEFKKTLMDYNKLMLALQKEGKFAKHLDTIHNLPADFVAFVMNQVYDRTVAPRVEVTRKYENGTDNVYGELNAPFISDILLERTKMTSEQVFVDLGSGVGQVVLQAALEVGCESWGCEQMETLKPLADDMLNEFNARCELWGIRPGKSRLICGDFLQNEAIHRALKRADVVLVNNQAFTSQLNDRLVSLFLDLKSGCKVVSLKTFVHEHKIGTNDLAANLLEVEHLTYPSGHVSWTDKGGTYCISTRR